MMASMAMGAMASGRLTLLITEIPRTRRPACTAAMTSGTVDMPTASAPIRRRNRVSAGVSRLGPLTAT